MKKLLLLSVALFFVSCAHTTKDKSCCAKGDKQCKVDKKKCDSKKCHMKKGKKHKHNQDHAKMSAEECDLNTCKIHRSPKGKM
ncbi:hypothetical protein [Halobacteriovorax marinus]|uniref:hypothetical protein n=1 Tax=Halobacteriovorax marinus TaxID=97084 RepID=UPI003A8ECE82